MRKVVLALALLVVTLLPVIAHEWSGTWSGNLVLPAGKLKLVLHLIPKGDSWSATLDSPMQGAKGLPVSSVEITGNTLKLVASNLGLSYTATIEQDKLTGTFSQGGMKLPLILKRELKQHSAHPNLPYTEQEVVVNKHPENILLAGTLTRPKGVTGKQPLIIFVTGSGPQNRDEELMGHKPFAVLADSLTRAGFMTYRYDDRGVGKSTGEYWQANLSSFVVDAQSVFGYMSQLPEVDAQRIYMLGHSEGGYIVARVAELEPKVKGIISMAGPSEPFRQVLVSQIDKISELANLSPAIRASNQRLNTAIYELAANPKLSNDALRSKVESLLKNHLSKTQSLPEEQQKQFIETTIKQVSSAYFREFAGTDPAKTWRAIKCPIIAFFGEKDVQVSPSNAQRLRELAPTAQIKVFKGLNHLMQPAQTGAIEEYAQISTTISPEVIQWLIDTLKKI